jgi:predicted ester cyclase
MSAAENKGIVREFVAAADRRDFERATGYLSPQVVVHLAGAPGPLDLPTFFQFGQAWHGAFPDEQTAFDDQMAEGDRVVSRMTSTATHTGEFQGIPPTGRRITVAGIWTDRVEGGVIAERWGVLDMLGVFQQLGVAPGHPTAEPPAASSAPVAGGQDAERSRAAVTRYFEVVDSAFQTGDVSGLDGLIAPGYREHLRVGDPPPTLEGLKQFIQLIRAAVPDARVAVEDVVAEGDRVMVRHRHRGTHTGAPFMGIPASGRAFDFEGVEIARISGDRIVESWHVDDNLSLLQHLGAIPAPGREPVAAGR